MVMTTAVHVLLAAAAVVSAYSDLGPIDAGNRGDLFGTIISRRRHSPSPQQHLRSIEPEILTVPAHNVTDSISSVGQHRRPTKGVRPAQNIRARVNLRPKTSKLHSRKPWSIPQVVSNQIDYTPVQARPIASYAVPSPLVHTPVQAALFAPNVVPNPFVYTPVQAGPFIPVAPAVVTIPQLVQQTRPVNVMTVPVSAGLTMLPIPGHCPQYATTYRPEVCRLNPLPPVYPFQCPVPTTVAVVPAADIKKIIYEDGKCQSLSECSSSLTELLLRLRLLEDRFRGISKAETRLKIYAEMLAQIQLRAGQTTIGKSGPQGPSGSPGGKGPRGARGQRGTCVKIGSPASKIGRPGLHGPKGSRGHAGVKLCNCNGKIGRPGFPGYSIQGTLGYKGVKGEQGTRGQDYSPI